MAHYISAITNEGRQVRFLRFFRSILKPASTEQEDMLRVNVLLDNFLPQFKPQENSRSLQLLYSYINRNTKNLEFFLKPTEDLVKESEAGEGETTNFITLYKDEPFEYHKELMQMFLDLLKTNLNPIVRSKLKKNFKFSYLMGILTQDQNELSSE